MKIGQIVFLFKPSLNISYVVKTHSHQVKAMVVVQTQGHQVLNIGHVVQTKGHQGLNIGHVVQTQDH